MSFILDALKKSEAERQRNHAPGIASIPQSGRSKSSSKWIWVVLALLAVNLAVLAGLLYKADTPGPGSSIEIANPGSGDAGVIPQTQIATAPTATPAVRPTPIQRQPVVSEPAPPLAAKPATADVVKPGTVDDGLETFNDLRAKGILSLPDMHLDIHVYSRQPADRFVFVNMKKYKESATLTEGPVVSEITPEGVVLSYRGTAFLLPRE